MYYESVDMYLQTATSLRAKIAALDAVIDALMLVAAKAAATDNISEYSLNDGQTTIRTMYRGAAAVFEAINAFERLRTMYANRLSGRVVRLVDGKNFTGGRC